MGRPQKQIIIAGPCAAESEEQIAMSIKEAKKRKIDFIRISLWKPRTKPGFAGVAEEGIHFLHMAAKAGVNPATEVIMPDHAQKVIDSVLWINRNIKLMVWIGARNQNHYIQQEIAAIAAKYPRVILMVKNQPWPSQEHWKGIIEHALHGGIENARLMVCHRGFAPDPANNPKGLRNIPDYKLAMKIKSETGLPMLFDPSHIGGSVDNVFKVARESARYPFDGIIVEVHPDPKNAKTDSRQQLTWEQFDMLREIIEPSFKMRRKNISRAN